MASEAVSTPTPSGSTVTSSPPASAVVRVGITPRAVLLALAITWLSGYWIRQSEIIVLACQGTEAVPSIPGTAALTLLVAANALLRRSRRIRPLSVPELVTIFLFVTVSTNQFGCAIGRFLIACLTAPFYYTSPAAPLEELARFIPRWLAPSDPVVHRWLYESSPTGHVPWGAWAWPMVSWTGLFVVFGGLLFCLMVLFSDTWVRQERLVFPLVRLPLTIMDPNYGPIPFFRNKATWIGIGLAVLLNAVNMFRGVFLGGPSGGLYIDLSKPLVGAPWDAMRPLGLHLRPELIGLGYLISTELSFSIWFSYLFLKAQAVVMSMSGMRVAGVPFAQEQGIGAYIVMAAVLFWKARPAFRSAARACLGFAGPRGQAPAEGSRWALIGAISGFIALVVLLRAAGLALWLAIVYLAILTAVSVAYARLRAETGVPLMWAFPYGLQHRVIKYFTSSRLINGLGPDYRSATLFHTLIVLSRGYFPSVSGYGIEGLTMGEQQGFRRSAIVTLLVAAIGFGAAASFWFHFGAYYRLGAIGVRGGLWGAWEAQPQYAALYQSIQMPTGPDVPRIVATLGGGALLGLLSFIRAAWFGSPFHPMGYAMACSYGELLWGSFLLVWLLKSVLLRYGGHKAYLNALPGFLGFAFGHFIAAGAVWGSLGAVLGGPFLRYGVWFG
jgi:hypothetical protein